MGGVPGAHRAIPGGTQGLRRRSPRAEAADVSRAASRGGRRTRGKFRPACGRVDGPAAQAMRAPRLCIGIDVGSTTVKAVLMDMDTDAMLWKGYERHEGRQLSRLLTLLKTLEA